VNGLRRDLSHSESANLHALPSLYDIARYIGEKVRQIQSQDREWLKKDGIDSQCSLLLGGQIQGQNLELYLIYTQGNFIQATQETPFLQVGEIKYGKHILDRILSYETSLEDAAKCALLSIDSTMKSNVSVGPPIDLVVAETNGLRISRHLRLGSGDPYISKIRKLWELSLKKAFEQMPTVEWEQAAAAQPSDGNLSDPKTRPCNA
jgi:putative proteasome-type protease